MTTAVGDEEGATVGAILGAIIGALSRRRGDVTKTEFDLHKHAVDVEFERIRAQLRAIQSQLAPVAIGAIASEASIIESLASPATVSTIAGDSPILDPSADAAPETINSWETTAPPTPSPPAFGLPGFIKDWLTGGNTIVRVGVLILFVGVGFLVKYAAENSLFPLELRLAVTALGAIGLLITGWRLRERRANYALTLQGAGIGVLYLTVFAAYRLYHFLPAELAFTLMAVISVLAALLAIRQNAMVLAVTSATGGFLAPILASSGGGSHVGLFSYYTLLNAGIFYIAWHKAWRPLNLVGFVFTFSIALMWGVRDYQPAFFATTEPFLILFFLAYVATAVLYAHQQVPRLMHYVDGTLIFGVPIIGFGLQASLVRGFEFGVAISSLVLSAFYLVVARWLHQRRHPHLRLLVESFLALGVIFGTLAIPLALDARWTSAAWALEGAGVYWIGARQGRRLARIFALLMQAFAGLAFLRGWNPQVNIGPLINAQFVGSTLIAVAGLITQRVMGRHAQTLMTLERILVPAMFWWGIGWWLLAGLHDIDHYVPAPYGLNATLAFLTLTAGAFSWASARFDWPEARWPCVGLLSVLYAIAVAGVLLHQHPFAHYGWAVWPLVLVAHYWMLRRHDADPPALLRPALHTGTMLLVAGLAAVELHELTSTFGLRETAWSVASVIVGPGLALLLVASVNAARRWPVGAHLRAYLVVGAIPLLAGLWLWSLYVNFSHDGSSAPLPYLPLLNALDLGHGFALVPIPCD